MKVNNLPKVATKNDFPQLRVEPGSLNPESDILPTEPPRPRTPLSLKQGASDQPYLQSAKATVLDSATGDAYNSARLAAATAPHSGDRLYALPIASCGLKLDNDCTSGCWAPSRFRPLHFS
jgi:hypothetical protein